MKTVTTNAVSKVAAIATGLAMAASMLSLAPVANAALSQSNIDAIVALLTSFNVDSATIANVKATLNGQPTTTTTTTTGSPACTFSQSLTVGATGSAVTCLQQALIGAGFSIPAGATGYYGSQTVAAVAAWQKAKNIAPAVGYFGPISRAAFTSEFTGSGSTTTTTTGGTTYTGTGTGLKVSLAPTCASGSTVNCSPSGTVLVQGQGVGLLGAFVFANPTASPINVTSLTFNRIGVSNDTTMSNVYLYNNGTRITDSAGVSSSAFTFSDPTALFTVPAGQTYTVAVRSDIADSSSGQQIGVSLVDAHGSTALDSSVHLPISGGLQTISAANLASVVFNGTTLPAQNSSLTPQADYTVWQNTVSVSTNPVNLASLRLTNLGSIDATNVQNLRLYVDGTMVGSAVPQLGADRTVTFDLSASPVLLSTADHIIKVIANITGGSNRTLQLSVQRSSDAMFVDSQLNQPVTLHTTNSTGNFSAASSDAQTIAAVSANSGVSVSRAAASPTSDVSVGATGVKLASFNMLASGEPVKVSDLYVYAATTTAPSSTWGTSAYLANGKIMVNGVQVGSTKTLGNTNATATDFSLGSSLILPAGTVTVVDIYADTKTTGGVNVRNGDSITVSLAAETSNAQGQSSLISTGVPYGTTSAADVSGNAVPVTSSALTATKYSGYGDQTMLAGTQNARLGSFTLSAGSTEGINVNTIAMSLHTSADVTNLMLKDDATGAQIGSTITTPQDTANNFSVNFTIPASGTKTIDVYGNILSTAAANDSVYATLTTSTTGTGAVTSTSASLSGTQQLQTITVGSGLLTVAVGAGNPANSNVIAGASSVQVSDYNFTSQNSAYTVQKLEIQVPSNAATSTTGVTIQYPDVNGATQTVSGAYSITTAATSTAVFSGLSFYVPQNSSADLKVFVGTPTISNGASSGAAINTTLLTQASEGFQAIDSTGTATTSIGTAEISGYTAGYGTMYVRQSVPTFAGQSVTTTAMPNAGTDLFRFTVSADPAGAVELDQLSFIVSTSTGAVAITNFSLYDAANTSTAVGTAVTADLNGIVKIPVTSSVIQIGAGQTKTFYLRAANYTGTWIGHNSVTVQFASADGTVAANAATGGTLNSGNNYVWSDRSAPSHTTSTKDWTNGYLLKDLTTGVYSFSN
ncbi:MAG: hypothetical protein B7X03_03830 [Parcubacteria group bacterium 21-58-10]|nr:MAG: hypothetical protein B7X03_03830 [Parcubacteria group bacterium 21-58-10]